MRVGESKQSKMTSQSTFWLTFEIAVLDVVTVEVVEALQHLLKDVAGIGLDELLPCVGLPLDQLVHTAIFRVQLPDHLSEVSYR